MTPLPESLLKEIVEAASKATPGKREVIRFDNEGGMIDFHALQAENAKLTARISDLSEKLKRAHSKKRFEAACAAMVGYVTHWQVSDEVMPACADKSVKFADALLERLALSESKEGEEIAPIRPEGAKG